MPHNDTHHDSDSTSAKLIGFGVLIAAAGLCVWLGSMAWNAISAADKPSNHATDIVSPIPATTPAVYTPAPLAVPEKNPETYVRRDNNRTTVSGSSGTVIGDGNTTNTRTVNSHNVTVNNTHTHHHTHTHTTERVEVVERVKRVPVVVGGTYTPSADCDRLKADHHRRVASYYDTLAAAKARAGR